MLTTTTTPINVYIPMHSFYRRRTLCSNDPLLLCTPHLKTSWKHRQQGKRKTAQNKEQTVDKKLRQH